MEEIQYIPNAKEMKKHVSPIYVINDYMRDTETYVKFRTSINNLLKGSIEHKECREYPVKFKFYKEDKTTYSMQLRHFYVNVIMWYGLKDLYNIHVLDESFIFKCDKGVTSKSLPEYINYVLIETLRDYNIKNNTINYNISEVMYNLRMISYDFAEILGLNMTVQTFLEPYNDNDRMKEIMNTQFSPDMQPSEIENKLNLLTKEAVDIYKSYPNNVVGVSLRTGTGMKEKQLGEFTVNGGLKPSLEGNTIPIPINSNTLTRGLNEVSSLYLDALGAWKSLNILTTINNSNCGENLAIA